MVAQTPVALGVRGGSFTVDGATRFLVLVSYFDGLDVSDARLAADFAWLKSTRVDGVRVFPNWWDKSGNSTSYPERPLVREDGSLDTARLEKLHRLLAIARRHGLIVDLSFSAENVRACAGSACATSTPFVPSGTLTKNGLRSALREIAADLRRGGFANTLIDMQNEVDDNSLLVHGSTRATLTADDIHDLAAEIRSANPSQVVTASFSGGTSASEAAAASSALDVVAWHETRDAGWWKATGRNLAAMRAATAKPIYLQEPQPSDEPGWTPDGAITGLSAAMNSGAAAWTFHTRSSFAMNGRSLRSIIDADRSPNDRTFLAQLSRLKGGSQATPMSIGERVK